MTIAALDLLALAKAARDWRQERRARRMLPIGELLRAMAALVRSRKYEPLTLDAAIVYLEHAAAEIDEAHGDRAKVADVVAALRDMTTGPPAASVLRRADLADVAAQVARLGSEPDDEQNLPIG